LECNKRKDGIIMDKSGIREIAIYFIIILAIIVGLLVFNSCQTVTPLEKCMSMSKIEGIFNDQGVDSAFLEKCERYHRHQIAKEDFNRMVPKMKFEKGKLVKDLKDGEIQYVPASKVSLKARLQYIENGTTDGIE